SKSAQERVVGFLLEMAKRGSSSGNSIDLPMSRQDIADYLGLTIETVSRTLWALENCGAIEISRRRRIQFRSRSTLVGLQQCRPICCRSDTTAIERNCELACCYPRLRHRTKRTSLVAQ